MMKLKRKLFSKGLAKPQAAIGILNRVTINEQNSIRIGGTHVVYFDPYGIQEEPHDADIIFFTHAHTDHFSPKAFRKVAKEDTIFVAPKTMREKLRDAGIEEKQTFLVKPEEHFQIGGFPVEAVPAYTIKRNTHPKENGWVGYVISIEGKRLYICGDMESTPEVERIDCDVVFVPIGGTYTLDAYEAAEFVNGLEPVIAVPTHYGTVVGKPEDGDIFESKVKQGIQVCRKL